MHIVEEANKEAFLKNVLYDIEVKQKDHLYIFEMYGVDCVLEVLDGYKYYHLACSKDSYFIEAYIFDINGVVRDSIDSVARYIRSVSTSDCSIRISDIKKICDKLHIVISNLLLDGLVIDTFPLRTNILELFIKDIDGKLSVEDIGLNSLIQVNGRTVFIKHKRSEDIVTFTIADNITDDIISQTQFTTNIYKSSMMDYLLILGRIDYYTSDYIGED